MPSSSSSSVVYVIPNLLAALLTVPLAVCLSFHLTESFLDKDVHGDVFGGAIGDFFYNYCGGISIFRGLLPVDAAILFHILLGVVTFIATLCVSAPYGSRLTHSKQDVSLLDWLCRWSVASTPAWILQEVPTLIGFGWVVIVPLIPNATKAAIVTQCMRLYSGAMGVVGLAATAGGESSTFATASDIDASTYLSSSQSFTFYPTILLFMLHYVHRTLVFPWLFVDGKGHLLRWRKVVEGAAVKKGDGEAAAENSAGKSVADDKKASPSSLSPSPLFKEEEPPIRHNPLLTVLLATLYCCFNGALQTHVNIRTHKSGAHPSPSVMTTMMYGSGGGSGASTSSVSAFFHYVFGTFFGFSHVRNPLVFTIGVAVFFIGMWINVTSDYYLFDVAHKRRRAQRAEKDGRAKMMKRLLLSQQKSNNKGGASDGCTDANSNAANSSSSPSSGYIIPRTFWFALVSAPNYFGELVEWSGYVIALYGAATSSSAADASGRGGGGGSDDAVASPLVAVAAALSFVFYTFTNLGPRAVASRQWYLRTFGEERYTTRWAILPYLW